MPKALSKFAGDAKLGGVADTLGFCAAIQSDLDPWRNGMKGTSHSSAKGNAKTCTWGGTTPGTSPYWGLTGRKAAL